MEAFWQFFQGPRSAAVYNLRGSRHLNSSMREAIELCEEISGRKIDWTYVDIRIWWISDVRRFQQDYPGWKYRYDLPGILGETHAACVAQ